MDGAAVSSKPSEHLLHSLMEFLISWLALWSFLESSALWAVWLKMAAGERHLQTRVAYRRRELVSLSHNGTGAARRAGGRLCSTTIRRDPGAFHWSLCHPQRVAFNCLQCVNTLSTFQPVRRGRGSREQRESESLPSKGRTKLKVLLLSKKKGERARI